MEGIKEYNKYESYTEETIDPQINPTTKRKIDSMSLYKIGPGKGIFIKAAD
jgi:hypothetical protein